MVVHNHLGESFYDGTLTYARLTDEDGVVLLSAPQNLHDALYLAFAAYTGVELVLCGSQRQISAEGVEHRRLRGSFLLGGGHTRLAGFASSVAGVLVFIFILVGQTDAVSHFCILRGEKHRQRVFIIHVVQF